MSQHTPVHTDSDASAHRQDEAGITPHSSENSGQLTLTRQSPLSPTASLTLDAPVGKIWEQIAASAGFQHALETAVNELVGDLRAGARAFTLEQCGVSTLDGLYASAVAAFADEDPAREQWREQAFQLTQEFGAAERSVVGFHAPAEEIANGPLAVLGASKEAPTVAVRVDDTFDALRADQRSEVIGLLADLATAVDLHVVATGRWQRKLAQEYREDLPGVSEQCSAGPSAGAIAETVEAAREAVDPMDEKSASSANSRLRPLKPFRTTRSTRPTRSQKGPFASVSLTARHRSRTSDSSKPSHGQQRGVTRLNCSLLVAAFSTRSTAKSADSSGLKQSLARPEIRQTMAV